MKITTKKYRYIEWLSAEEMHERTIQWVSELKFVLDELLFLNSLIKSYTQQLISSDIFDDSKEMVDGILKTEKECVKLMKKVESHENLLEIMINDVDELAEENAYTKSHWDLTSEIEHYLSDYKKLKTKVFNLISGIIKREKQKRLLS